jgi:hypothetical protein
VLFIEIFDDIPDNVLIGETGMHTCRDESAVRRNARVGVDLEHINILVGIYTHVNTGISLKPESMPTSNTASRMFLVSPGQGFRELSFAVLI